MLGSAKKYLSKFMENRRRRNLPQDAQQRNNEVDSLEREMVQHEQVNCPVEDIFTPGIYTRKITLPKGTLLTSEIHKTKHPFFILSGVVEVANVDTGEAEILKAPYHGITQPYTRRVLNVIEETVWITCHATKETDVQKIGEKILVQRDNVVPQYKLNEKMLEL